MVRYGAVGVLRCGEKYDITFARYDWSGVMAACTVFSRDSLQWFLLNKIRLVPYAVQELLAQVDAEGSGCVENVALSDEFRLRCGLVAPAEGIRAA